jgi:hypothetical protein
MSLDRLARYLHTDGLCREPVFIIGSPRSGTTALGHALGRHPELWVSKESYFLHQLFGNGRPGQVWEHNQKRPTPSWLREEQVARAEFLGFIGIGMNALFSSRSGGRRWVDQTPLYTPMADDLADMFPGAKFLHLVRDGRSVVRSMSHFENVFDEAQRAALTDELPAWVSDFRLACETWSQWVETGLDFGGRQPERCLLLRNEDLAQDPHAGFQRIWNFLGLDQDVGPVRRFAGSPVASSFRATSDAPGWDEWDAHLRETFADAAGATLVRAGYETDDGLRAWVAA